jgi:hypothetical protein
MPDHSECQSRDNDLCCAAEDEREDVFDLGAERHAHSELAAALGNGKSQDAGDVNS